MYISEVVPEQTHTHDQPIPLVSFSVCLASYYLSSTYMTCYIDNIQVLTIITSWSPLLSCVDTVCIHSLTR